MLKPKILYIIDNYGAGGGAENLLFETIQGLVDYEIHLVALYKPDNLIENTNSKVIYHFMDIKGIRSWVKAFFKIRAIIFKNHIQIVHAHLYHSIIFSRLFCPRNVRLICSYHSAIYGTRVYKGVYKMIWLDMFTYRKKSIDVYVSNFIKETIENTCGVRENSVVLHNFISNNYFRLGKINKPFSDGDTLKVIMVGNSKKEKNHELIYNALKSGLENCNMTIDIWGIKSNEKSTFSTSKRIKECGFNLNLGKKLSDYHLFLSTSVSEAFGMAVVEAMSVGLPVLLSDIPAFKEVANQNAIFFASDNKDDLISKIKSIIDGEYDLGKYSQLSSLNALKFNKKAHIEQLSLLYSTILNYH